MPVDHPLVAIADRGRLHLRRIAARHLRLRQPDGGIDVARHERLEKPLALLRAGIQVQHDRVLHADGADGELTVLRAADDLVQVDEVHERQAAAADLLRMAERPEPAALGLGLERGERARRTAGALGAGTADALSGLFAAGLRSLVELERQTRLGVEAVLALALELRLGSEHDTVDEGLHASPELADLFAHPDRLRHEWGSHSRSDDASLDRRVDSTLWTESARSV